MLLELDGMPRDAEMGIDEVGRVLFLFSDGYKFQFVLDSFL